MELKQFKENPKSSSTSFIPLQGPSSKHVEYQKDYKNIPIVYVLGIRPLSPLLTTRFSLTKELLCFLFNSVQERLGT